MEKMVEVDGPRKTSCEDLNVAVSGPIRLTLEMVLEEELKAMVGARRFERVPQERAYLRRRLRALARRDGPAQPGRRLARRRDGSLPAQE